MLVARDRGVADAARGTLDVRPVCSPRDTWRAGAVFPERQRGRAERRSGGPDFEVHALTNGRTSRLDLLSSEVAGFAGIETHTYTAGEPMRPLERLKRLHLWIVRGGLALQVETTRGIRSIIEVFGPCSSLDPRHWDVGPGGQLEAVALLPTETLELPIELFRQQLSDRPALALALASKRAHQHARSLDRVAVLCLRDPLRRVSGALLQLAERLGSSTPSARGSQLELTQHLIAAFADLSRQTTNRQLRRLAAVQLVDLKRGLVSVWDVAALAEVATGRRQL